jgi:CRP-like cAMP-binding protein|tara:strand:- start:917 stop:1447 length:531 start_codon:yes stop_codon:yes gene_type:complete
MPVSVPAGFLVINSDPIDGRMVVADASARKNLATYNINNAYQGLLVYEQSTDKLFALKDPSIANTDSGWEEIGSNGSGSGTPGGANTQIQFNDSGDFEGSPKLTFNQTTGTTTMSGSLLISGSNTDDIFLVKSGNIEVAKVDQNGNFILVERTGATPTAVAGGIMYSSSAFYVGID